MTRDLNIIGCGKVGRVFGTLCARHGVANRIAVCNRSRESSERMASIVPLASAVDSIEDLPEAKLWMISCSDSAIRDVAAAIAQAPCLKPGDLVFHVSGALTSGILEEVRGRGAHVGSLHPIRSIANPELVLGGFGGTVCAVEGDPCAVDELTVLATGIGAKPFNITSEAKLLCHAGHVFASNYVVTMIDVATRIYRSAGVPAEAIDMFLPPIVRGTIENVCALGTTDALTGPVVRGELELLAKQSEALEAQEPQIAKLYRACALHAAEVALRKGHLSAETEESLRRFVSNTEGGDVHAGRKAQG